jgi:hypothetical protein
MNRDKIIRMAWQAVLRKENGVQVMDKEGGDA